MSDYEKLLEKAYKELPEKSKETERFELPKADIDITGSRTIIKNFKEIATTLRRDPMHFYKYVTRELAAPGNLEGSRLILKGRIPPRIIYQKIENYINDYVLCKECGKPDTQIVDEQGVKLLKCEACGARKAIREVR